MKRQIVLLSFFLFSIFGFTQEKINQKIDSLFIDLDSTNDKGLKSVLLFDIATEYLRINIDSSISIYKQAKQQAIRSNNDSLEINSIIGLGLAFTKSSEFDSARVSYSKANQKLKNTSFDELRKKLFMNKGVLAFYEGDYNQAKKEFERVLKLAQKDNDLDELSRCYNNIALCNANTGNYEEALIMHIESAKIAEQLNDEIGLAKSYNNIGLVYFDLNDYDKSEEYALKSLKIKERNGDKIGVIGCYLNLGNTLRKDGAKKKDSLKLNKAKYYYQNALELSKNSSYVNGKNNALTNLALVETSLGNYINGIKYGKKALKASLDSKDSQKEMISRINLGDAYRYNGQFELAKEQLLKGYDLALNQNNLYIQKETLLILSLLNSDKKYFKEALKYHKDYFNLNDSISSSEVKNKVNELETKYETEKKEKEILVQRAELAEQGLTIQRRNFQVYGLIGIALLFGVLGYLFYNQQKLKNNQLKKENELKIALSKIENQNRLQEQRLRISRDLHDNIGAQLTFIISSLDNLKYGFDLPDKLSNKLDNIGEFTSSTIFELRDTIWAMNKNSISFEDLQSRISNFVDKADVSSKDIDFSFNVDNKKSLEYNFTSIQGINIYRVIQEALNNAIKYSKASKIDIDIQSEKKNINISIIDNGIGFDKTKIEFGNGLNNIEKRALELNGNATINSNVGKGTQVVLDIPITS